MKKFFRQILLIVILIVFAFFASFIFYPFLKKPIKVDLTPLQINLVSLRSEPALLTASTTVFFKQKIVVFGLPVRIKIPSIDVDAIIERVGLTSDGVMNVPKLPDNTAWFKLGPHPGEIGAAVIAGHYGWKNNIPAVFDNLHKLNKGDKVYVEDDNGVVITFVVRESRMYGENEDASGVFGSGDGKAHLNLITCEGIWNKVSKSYSGRLVVFTDRE